MNLYKFKKRMDSKKVKEVSRADSNDVDIFDVDDLIIKRKGGGSIIDKRPLFSTDGE